MDKEVEKELLEILKRNYSGDFPKSKDEAVSHTTGDTLADFILIECLEVSEGEENLHDACITSKQAMNRAIEDLEGVRDGLYQKHQDLDELSREVENTNDKLERAKRRFASVSWSTNDLLDLADELGIKITKEQAEQFLARHQDDVRPLMAMRGWAALETLLYTENYEKEKDSQEEIGEKSP